MPTLGSLQGAAWRRAEFVHRLLLLSDMSSDPGARSTRRRRCANDSVASEPPRDDEPKT
jgi:hypothetical protein